MKITKTIGGGLTVFLFMSVFAVAPAFATDLTLFGGLERQGKFTFNSAAATLVKNPFNAGVFGIRVSSGNVLGHEETLAFVPNFIDSNSKAFIMSSNMLLSVPSPVLKPYATLGLGTFVVKGSGVSDIGTKFAFNYGGGVKLLPAGPVGVRADVRGYTLTGVQGHKLNTVEATLGVVFRF